MISSGAVSSTSSSAHPLLFHGLIPRDLVVGVTVGDDAGMWSGRSPDQWSCSDTTTTGALV